MKKILLTTALILALTAPYANAAEVNYVMKYEKMPEGAEWGEVYKVVAVDKESGKVIPISDCNTDYGYAYVPEGTEVAFETREKIQFNDINSEWGGPAGLDDLTRRGIFSGDENGNFNGKEILTRAQMTALLARIIGADGEAVGDMPFTDVPKDAWFASSIYALYSRGIVAGDELFNPERPVTREELVTMEYRIIKMLGGKFKESAEMPDKYIDFDSVSEYAKLPYSAMEASLYHVPYDYVDTEPFYDEYGTFYERLTDKLLLNPQSTVTRTDAAMYMYWCFILDFTRENSPAIATDAAATFGLDAEMPRITGSTSSYPITECAYGALFTNYRNHPIFPESHDKTIDSYKLLLDGKTDVIIVPDPNNEVKELAAEKGVELEYIPIADEALVFFTAADNPADNLTSADIEKIYIGNSVTNWNEIDGTDAGFTAFCRNGDSGSHAQMEQFFLHGREINENIRREHMSLAMSSILTEVDAYNKHNAGSYALGYSMYYYFQRAKWVVGTDDLKLLSVDGVEPTAESLADGSYPLSTHYYAVIRSDEKEDSPARKFAAFLTSEAGQVCISNAGFGARR